MKNSLWSALNSGGWTRLVLGLSTITCLYLYKLDEVSHSPSLPHVHPLTQNHSDSCLPISNSADESPLWWPRGCCLSSYGIAASSCTLCVECLIEGNEVVDAVMLSRLHRLLDLKILLKAYGLSSLYPHCSTILRFTPTFDIQGSRWPCGSCVELVV